MSLAGRPSPLPFHWARIATPLTVTIGPQSIVELNCLPCEPPKSGRLRTSHKLNLSHRRLIHGNSAVTCGSRPTVASGGTEMIARYRTLADSGALNIRGSLQGREITPGCRPVSLTRHFFGKQSIVFSFDDRITFAATLFQPRAIEHHDVSTKITNQPSLLNLSAASVTPSRRTPSMLAISSCVITSSLPSTGPGSTAASDKVADRASDGGCIPRFAPSA